MSQVRFCTTAPAEMRAFSESVSENAGKTLTLLRAIEETVSSLAWMQRRAEADSKYAVDSAEFLRTCERVAEIDPDGTIVVSLEEAESRLEKLHEVLRNKRQAAVKASELRGDDKDAVTDAYSAAIAAVADLHNHMGDLRWAIGEHDADLEKPTGEAFADPEKLKAYLKSI